ncbi:MAG: hypothetical protein QOJ89_5250 [bacterium]
MTVSDHRDLVAALLGVPGVAAASVEPQGGGPGTLRLQLSSGADEVDVAGAVNRLLRSQFGLAVDADRVRVLEQTGGRSGLADAPAPTPLAAVAPLAPRAAARGRGAKAASSKASSAQPAAVEGDTPDPPDTAPAGTPSGADPAVPAVDVPLAHRRLVIERVQLVSADLGVTVSVGLRSGDRSFAGESEGAATTSALLRSIAAATLRAVEQVVGGAARFDVEHVEIASTGEEQTALVVISMVTARGNQRLSGASVVRDDARQAVIRAVLAAVNRRLGPLMGEVAG